MDVTRLGTGLDFVYLCLAAWGLNGASKVLEFRSSHGNRKGGSEGGSWGNLASDHTHALMALIYRYACACCAQRCATRSHYAAWQGWASLHPWRAQQPRCAPRTLR